jgi:hypothetical protein
MTKRREMQSTLANGIAEFFMAFEISSFICEIA